MTRTALVLTCEHASQRIPRRYARLFAGAEDVLASHRGHDIGALAVARHLGRALDARLFVGRVSRLLVDLNRSAHHPRVFSAFTRSLDAGERQAILARHYHPYRDAVTSAIASQVADGARVLHVAVHSFTPVLEGRVRTTDLGLLYDPGREWERDLAARWKRALGAAAPDLRVRRNDPYRGVSDGLTTWLRQRFPNADYAGIELECNQAMTGQARSRERLAALVGSTLPRMNTDDPGPEHGQRSIRSARGM